MSGAKGPVSAMQVRLSDENVRKLFDLQFELNNLYSGGNEWFVDPIYDTRFRAAAMMEMAEFLHEINREWNWYSKDKQHFSAEQGLFELVDVVHFALSGILRTEEIDFVKKHCDWHTKELWGDPEVLFNGTTGRVDSILTSFDSIWASIRNYTNSGTVAHIGRATLHLNNFIAESLHLLGYDVVDFMTAYRMKNRRNRDRVFGGVMCGVDVKKNEKPLSLVEVKEAA